MTKNHIGRIAGACLLSVCVGVFIGVKYQEPIAIQVKALTGKKQVIARQAEKLPEVSHEVDTLHASVLDQPLPLIYSQTLEEERIQEDLKKGAAVLPLGVDIGKPGNVVITAHSTGTTSFGPYRFAFAKLSEIQEGQTFSIQTKDATYTYRVYGSEVVWPHEVDKLPNDERSTITLVTCWPLWTDYKRLLVHAQLSQVSYPVN